MDHHEIARILLAFICGLQGAATLAIDLNRTHARHPGWMGHARFHVVWQTVTQALFAVLEICLVLIGGSFQTLRFYLAAALAATPMLAFFVAVAARHWYGGTLSDPQGMPPLVVNLRGFRRRIDMNVVAEILGLIGLCATVAIYRAQ